MRTGAPAHSSRRAPTAAPATSATSTAPRATGHRSPQTTHPPTTSDATSTRPSKPADPAPRLTQELTVPTAAVADPPSRWSGCNLEPDTQRDQLLSRAPSPGPARRPRNGTRFACRVTRHDTISAPTASLNLATFDFCLSQASLCQPVPSLYQPAPNVIPSCATIHTRMDSGPPVDGSVSSVVIQLPSAVARDAAAPKRSGRPRS